MKKNITTKNIDAVLKFLPYFEDNKNKFYEVEVQKDGYFLMCPYIYSKEVMTFMETLYNENIVFSFDWGEWQEEAIRYFNNPDLIKSADILTLRKLLTLHVRKDRFLDGHLTSVIDSGHLVNILKRLKEIYTLRIIMEFKNLTKLIFGEIKPKLENNQGLSIFAKERAKFEGWLKVELCDSISKYFKDVAPERNRIDVTFENWAIELKTVNTNIRYKNVKNKTKPITKNTQRVINDIEKLKSTDYTNRAILFVVFPITHNNEYWQVQLQRISKLLREIKHVNFNFKDEIPGVVYFGLI